MSMHGYILTSTKRSFWELCLVMIQFIWVSYKHNIMLILHISVFLKVISFMLHVVSCYIGLYLYNIYTNSNLKFFITYFMCILCKSRLMYESIFVFVHYHHVLYCIILHEYHMEQFFMFSTIHHHGVSCAILVSHIMYIILILYLTMFFNFQGLFWTHYLHVSIHMYVQLCHYIKCTCLVWYSLQCNEMWSTPW